MAQLSAFRMAAKADATNKNLITSAAQTSLDNATSATMLVRFRTNDENPSSSTHGRIETEVGQIRLDLDDTAYEWNISSDSISFVEIDANKITGSWQYRVVTVDFSLAGSEIKAYTPGTAASNGPDATGSIAGNNLADATIGFAMRASGNDLDIDVAEVAVWEGVLSAAEIDALNTNEALNITPSSATLVAAYVCKDESSGNVSVGDENLKNRAPGGFPDIDSIVGEPTYISDGPEGLALAEGDGVMATLTVTRHLDDGSITAELTGDNIGSFGGEATLEVREGSATGTIVAQETRPGGQGPGEITLTTQPLDSGEYWVTSDTIDGTDPQDGPFRLYDAGDRLLDTAYVPNAARGMDPKLQRVLTATATGAVDYSRSGSVLTVNTVTFDTSGKTVNELNTFLNDQSNVVSTLVDSLMGRLDVADVILGIEDGDNFSFTGGEVIEAPWFERGGLDPLPGTPDPGKLFDASRTTFAAPAKKMTSKNARFQSFTRREDYDVESGTVTSSSDFATRLDFMATNDPTVVTRADDPADAAKKALGFDSGGLQGIDLSVPTDASANALVCEFECYLDWTASANGDYPDEGTGIFAMFRKSDGENVRFLLRNLGGDTTDRVQANSSGGGLPPNATARADDSPSAKAQALGFSSRSRFPNGEWRRMRVILVTSGSDSDATGSIVLILFRNAADDAWLLLADFIDLFAFGNVSDLRLHNRGFNANSGDSTGYFRRVACVQAKWDDANNDLDMSDIWFGSWNASDELEGGPAAMSVDAEADLFVDSSPVLFSPPSWDPNDETKYAIRCSMIYDDGLYGYPTSPASDNDRPRVRFQWSIDPTFSTGVNSGSWNVVQDADDTSFNVTRFIVDDLVTGLPSNSVVYFRAQIASDSASEGSPTTLNRLSRYHFCGAKGEASTKPFVMSFGGCTNNHAFSQASGILSQMELGISRHANVFGHLDDLYYRDSAGLFISPVLNTDANYEDQVARGFRSCIAAYDWETLWSQCGAIAKPGDHGWNVQGNSDSDGDSGVNSRAEEATLVEKMMSGLRTIFDRFRPPNDQRLLWDDDFTSLPTPGGFTGNDEEGNPYVTEDGETAVTYNWSRNDFLDSWYHVSPNVLLFVCEDQMFRNKIGNENALQLFDETQFAHWEAACQRPHKVMLLITQSPPLPLGRGKQNSHWLAPTSAGSQPTPKPELKEEYDRWFQIWLDNAPDDAVLIVCSGDIHSTFATSGYDLPVDPTGKNRIWKFLPSACLPTGNRVNVGTLLDIETSAFPGVPANLPNRMGTYPEAFVRGLYETQSPSLVDQALARSAQRIRFGGDYQFAGGSGSGVVGETEAPAGQEEDRLDTELFVDYLGTGLVNPQNDSPTYSQWWVIEVDESNPQNIKIHIRAFQNDPEYPGGVEPPQWYLDNENDIETDFTNGNTVQVGSYPDARTDVVNAREVFSLTRSLGVGGGQRSRARTRQR